jgi:hypothetical protein
MAKAVFDTEPDQLMSEAQKLRAKTLENSGYTYSTQRGEIPLVKGKDPTKPDVFVVGGAPEPDEQGHLGHRFPSHVLSVEQFTPNAALGHVLKAHLAQNRVANTGGPEYGAGTWMPDEGHSQHGQVVLDIPDIHPGGEPWSSAEDQAHEVATSRGEEEYLHNQGPGEWGGEFLKTKHSEFWTGSRR